ncbi:tyrosine-type recombinase/integrase [Streptomyces sp. NBC_01187]|uniref:tyrosine-type recombinase/integrase n=1 Tax=Streptomyces sp. NBC_01187 TaxID=2903766 RepID=UPI00386A45EB|nr:site-specific integrase [Streptomyces sp. NBC_01187]
MEPTGQQRSRQDRAMARVLDWLGEFPGESWQDRWLLSGSDTAGKQWGPPWLTQSQRCRLTAGLGTLIVLRAVRPSYAWLCGSRLLGVYYAYRRHNQTGVFARLRQQADGRGGCDEHGAEALNLLTRMAIVTGKELLELEVEDFEQYAAARRASGRTVASLPFAYEILHGVRGLKDGPPTLRQARAPGQLTPAELVDRYRIAHREIRDVLVHYVAERAAVLDYGSLVNQAHMLAGLFWADLERHHPGISSLHLPDGVAQEWKQRARLLPDGRPRRNSHNVLLAVRSFYLDLLQWSLEDPARWSRWAAPCPISEADVRSYLKETRHRQARVQQRTRTLVPVLPRLVTAAEDRLRQAELVLAAARKTEPGQEFTASGQRYRRTGRATSRWRPTAVFVTPLAEPETRFDAECEESNAFWTWAVIEVLRRTGARIEELLELTHLSLRQYQAPTGELVPLLQISPSKTDQERAIAADPDLVAVLASIIRRIKNPDGKVPLLSRYDGYERTFGPPLPHLFQRVSQHRLQVISPNRVRELLAERADIVDVDGTPLRFTPHDFRRIFSTETVNGGLPIHIAAKVLGHLDLNTTQGYVAVYPEEVIRHYRHFVDQRRAARPSEEYREPAAAEWDEFRDHFSLRKVALGTCDRPYGTPCQHEHACVRCPMLRLDLAQVPRLLEIETNTRERLEEAHRMQWLGEVAALKESLRHITEKKKQADRLRRQTEQGEIGTDAVG